MGTMTPNRVAAYLRLSLARDDSASIAAQRRLVREEAERRGWPAPVLYVDEGVSGSKDVRRPKRDELEARVAAGEYGALIAKSVDRLARSTVDFHRIAQTCRKAGCSLVVTDLGLDTSTAVGEMVLGVLAQIAAFEVRMTGERMKVSNVERVSAGRAIGGPVAYGFRNVRRTDAPGTYRTVDREEADVIRRIARDLLDGYSLHAIAGRLDAEGVPTPRASTRGVAHWGTGAVRRVVENPLVAGMQRFRGELVRDEETGLPRVDADESILDAETYRRVCEVLKAREVAAVGRAAKRTPYRERLLLDDLAVCDGCDRPMRRSSSRGGRYLSYVCSASTNACRARAAVAAGVLDGYVVGEFLAAAGRLPVVEAVEVVDEDRGELAAVRAEIHETGARIAAADTATIPMLSERLIALRQHEARILDEAGAEPTVEYRETGETFAEAWEAAEDVVAQRALLSSALEAVRVRMAGPRVRVPVSERVTLAWAAGNPDPD